MAAWGKAWGRDKDGPVPAGLGRLVTTPAAASEPVTPRLSDAQMEDLANRVAVQLATRVIDDRLREVVLTTVTEVSERLVREEIARIRADAERDER